MTPHPPVALSVAGSDSGGGAGIQADLRMFSARGVYGTTAITAITAQHPGGVTAVEGLSAQMVLAQVDAVLGAFPVGGVKTGMLWSAEIVRQLAARFGEGGVPVVVDPVMVATSGARLLEDDAVEAYQRALLPVATLATPNLDEAAVLLGAPVTAEDQPQAAQTLRARLGCAVLLKGGHLSGDPIDLLACDDGVHTWTRPRIEGVNTHGSGCMLSAAIAAELAHGCSLVEAVAAGLDATHRALAAAWAPIEDIPLARIEVATPRDRDARGL